MRELNLFTFSFFFSRSDFRHDHGHDVLLHPGDDRALQEGLHRRAGRRVLGREFLNFVKETKVCVFFKKKINFVVHGGRPPRRPLLGVPLQRRKRQGFEI